MIGSRATIEGLETGLTFWTREASQAMGRRIVQTIRQRTLRGIAADGRAFKPYAPGYDRADTVTPDLRDSGRLLNALQVTQADERGAFVEAPGVPYAAVVDAQRPFMGVAPGEVADLDRLVDELVDEANR